LYWFANDISLDRLCQQEGIGNEALFLASHPAPFNTGSVLHLAGEQVAKV
jgi:enoyl-[acyl-carrier-protein] reductase (NADH)